VVSIKGNFLQYLMDIFSHHYGGNIKRYLTETEVVVPGSEWYLWARYREHCNENWGYIKGWEFLVEQILALQAGLRCME
jgi:hypothetical protein